MSIRNYFRPSNEFPEPMGSLSIALKSREQRTSSPPRARSAEYFLHTVPSYCTFYSISQSGSVTWVHNCSTEPLQSTAPNKEHYLSSTLLHMYKSINVQDYHHFWKKEGGYVYKLIGGYKFYGIHNLLHIMSMQAHSTMMTDLPSKFCGSSGPIWCSQASAI